MVRAVAANRARYHLAAYEDAVRLMKRTDDERRWGPNNPTLRRARQMVKAPLASSEEELRAKRRARMRAISDEALYDLEAYTTLIYRVRRGT